MNIRNRITAWLLTIAVFLMTLLLVSALLAPRLIHLETVKELIEEKFSQDMGITIAYQRLDLSYFPRPHVVIQGVTFSIPTDVTGEMPSLRIYPKILPLFRGKFQITAVYHKDHPGFSRCWCRQGRFYIQRATAQRT
jgi:hypothetical protein